MFKRISDREFANVLQKAVAGDINAIYQIIDIYDGLILKNSTVKGTFNQECRDFIEDKIVKEIKNLKKSKVFWENSLFHFAFSYRVH